jgi:hypothetical protein
MKLFYSVALPLFVWFLMTPPMVGPGEFDTNAPMSHWMESARFGSAQECSANRIAVVDYYWSHPKEDNAQSTGALFHAGKCVAEQDSKAK